jgi:hypothetical protein
LLSFLNDCMKPTTMPPSVVIQATTMAAELASIYAPTMTFAGGFAANTALICSDDFLPSTSR